MAFRTGNPALGAQTFSGLSVDGAERMTLAGTARKSVVLLAIAGGAAFAAWSHVFSRPTDLPSLRIAALAASLAGFGVAVAIILRHRWSPALAPVYALLEGIVLGLVSAVFESRFPGIAAQAIALTFGVFAVLLAAYASGAISPTENFKLGVVAATGGVAVVYLISIGARLFGHSVPYIHDSGPIGIGFSVVVVCIAAANLVLDFDFIEEGVRRGAPKYMEWYAAFGLLVTLVWLYLEILRLLSKAKKR
jgi:uncharacterized YccA/Bax inhibitor family protein